MRKCKHAKSLGKPCEDGSSRRVQCEMDGVIRCLKDCVVGCANYVEVPETVVSGVKPARYNPVNAHAANTSYKAYKSNTGNTANKGGCGAPCGGGVVKKR